MTASTFAARACSAQAAASIWVRVVSSVAHQRVALGPSSGYHLASGEAADDLLFEEGGVGLFGGRREIEDELVEAGCAFEEEGGRRRSFAALRMTILRGGQGLAEVGGFGEVVFGELAQALLAVDGEEDGDHHGDERLVGADVAGGLLAADVLLAGGEGEDEAALAVHVVGLADEAAGHLAQEFFLAGDDAAVGAAEAEGYAEGLRLHGDDVGFGGRA